MTHAEIQLTPKEREILQIYRHPSNSRMGPAIRQTAGYAVSAGIFLYLAITRSEPLFAIGIYVIFMLQLILRLLKARVLVGVMSEILRRYETQLGELQQQLDGAKDREN
jgi:hypothetical protein